MGPTQASTNNMWLQNKLSPPSENQSYMLWTSKLGRVSWLVLWERSFSNTVSCSSASSTKSQKTLPLLAFLRLGLENLHSFLACWESSGLRGWKLNLTQIWTNKRWIRGAERLPMWVNNRGFKTWPSGENITRHQYLDSSFYLQREHSFWSGGG